MSRIRRYMPRPGLVVAIVALLAATAGTSYAIRGQFGVGKLKEGSRQKVVGIGKLVYTTTTINVPVTTAENPTTTVKAQCPSTPGNLQPISGGVKLEVKDPAFQVLDSHHIANGWTATVYNDTAAAYTAQVTLACARSIAVTGTPPAS